MTPADIAARRSELDSLEADTQNGYLSWDRLQLRLLCQAATLREILLLLQSDKTVATLNPTAPEKDTL